MLKYSKTILLICLFIFSSSFLLQGQNRGIDYTKKVNTLIGTKGSGWASEIVSLSGSYLSFWNGTIHTFLFFKAIRFYYQPIKRRRMRSYG